MRLALLTGRIGIGTGDVLWVCPDKATSHVRDVWLRHAPPAPEYDQEFAWARLAGLGGGCVRLTDHATFQLAAEVRGYLDMRAAA